MLTIQVAIAALTIRAAYDAITNATTRDLIQMVHNLQHLGLSKHAGYESHHAVSNSQAVMFQTHSKLKKSLP